MAESRLTRDGLGLQVVLKAVTGEEMEADSAGHTSSAALALQSICLGHPHQFQALHALAGIISREDSTNRVQDRLKQNK